MFFLGQPVLPLRCFFSFRKFRPEIAEERSQGHGLMSRGQQIGDMGGAGGTPQAKHGLWENIWYLYHPLSIWVHVYTLMFISIYNIHNSTCIFTEYRKIMSFCSKYLWKQLLERNKRWRRWSETWQPSNISPATWDTTAPGPGVTVFTGMKGRARHGCFQK